MKKVSITLSFLLAFYFQSFAGDKTTYEVSLSDIRYGYIVKKIWLNYYAPPAVQITEIQYAENQPLPADALPAATNNIHIRLGKDLKRPFAYINIPAYAPGADGKVKRVTSFTLSVTEAEIPEATTDTRSSMAKTTASNSALAAGTWYKIAVPNTGLYKVDYNMLSQMGVNISAINTANIRVFGNGGNMLSENNAIPRKDDLTENAIWVNDGGDGKFDAGDYFVFYAVGPISWEVDAAKQRFVHHKNLYEEKAFYFLNFDQGIGKRISQQSNTPVPTTTVTSFNNYQLHEQDLFNPGKFGKMWWGEDFGADPGKVGSRTIDIDMGPVADSAWFRILVGSRSGSGNNIFNLSLNGQGMGSVVLGPAGRDDNDYPVSAEEINWSLATTGGNASVKIDYQSPVSSGTGYLNFIEVNSRGVLSFTGAQLNFRDLRSVGAGQIAGYQLGNATTSTQVWDVTDPSDPVLMKGSLNGSTFNFAHDATILREFAALNNDQLAVPEYVGLVPNQDLHGTPQVDYIIVVHPNFVNAAGALADFHRSYGLRVVVATTTQVYNEFSSGSQDVSAIRDFARMFYKRAGSDTSEMPRYLLLFGDASYDYKDRTPANTNYVPTFESEESFSVLNSFCNDDFFSFLDDNEYIENVTIANTMDMGVGRLPVTNASEAMKMVDKIKHYKSPASLGPWRLSTTMVADDEDLAGPHMEDGEIMDSVVQKNSNIYNGSKVYQDAIQMISTPGGARAPEANKAINDQIFKGTFLVNYNGHGNTQVLSHERILTQDDFNSWKNYDKMPFMVTATCDFGRFDHPDYVSAGEKLVLKTDGGVIATLTTTQLVYQFANRIINKDYIDAQFKKTDGRWNTFGDAFRIAKNGTYATAPDQGTLVNFRKFALLGDPALEPNFPHHKIRTEAIKDETTLQDVDTIGALGAYRVDGMVTDELGNTLENFNGRLSVSIFDKPRTVKTITPINKTFDVQNNIIYKGKATVTNGKFSVSFIAPKDLNYDYGEGKISYYAENGATDGAGADVSYTVGGFSKNPVVEDDAPIVRPYIIDSMFRNGGVTGSNTELFVILDDATGINVSGNNVGHDLVAILDDNVKAPYVLNDYYETAPNTYKRGYVTFPITGLSDGKHTLRVRAWDVNNNSGEGTVDFEVANGNIVKVVNLINYPNPFRDVTHFRFEHNHLNEQLTAEIQVFTTSGSLVKTLKQEFTPTGSHSNEITWDGTGTNGVHLPSGIYLYRMRISTAKGNQETAYQKLVLIR